MQVKKLIPEFKKLQKQYGDKNFDAIFGAGSIKNPEICFVFMNPTSKNISTNFDWKGLKAPWVGTKNVWKMFYNIGILEENIWREIESKKPKNWDYSFTEKLYKYIENKNLYITNLAKCTFADSTNPSISIFKKYIPTFWEEMKSINPKKIITFGGSVSSVILGKNIKISKFRKKREEVIIGKNTYNIFPCYYPVGQGMRNIKLAKEDINWILMQ